VPATCHGALRRHCRGILFHGAPGTGKTLAVRALAGACARHSPTPVTFFSRKGADCLGKFMGEAERTLRLMFEEVRERLSPALAPKRLCAALGCSTGCQAWFPLLRWRPNRLSSGELTGSGATSWQPFVLEPSHAEDGVGRQTDRWQLRVSRPGQCSLASSQNPSSRV
jgi:ATPase family associated with various cellular activities (AAA)